MQPASNVSGSYISWRHTVGKLAGCNRVYSGMLRRVRFIIRGLFFQVKVWDMRECVASGRNSQKLVSPIKWGSAVFKSKHTMAISKGAGSGHLKGAGRKEHKTNWEFPSRPNFTTWAWQTSLALIPGGLIPWFGPALKLAACQSWNQCSWKHRLILVLTSMLTPFTTVHKHKQN